MYDRPNVGRCVCVRGKDKTRSLAGTEKYIYTVNFGAENERIKMAKRVRARANHVTKEWGEQV
jgi:hypothetical protein